MKNIYLYAILLLGILGFAACEDDASPVLSVKSPARLEALSQSEYKFTASNAGNEFAIYWIPADFGFVAVVDYTVTLTNKDNGKNVRLGVTKDNKLVLTNAEMNSYLGKVKVYPGEAGNLSISLSCSAYAGKLDTDFTDTIDFKATPYDPKAVTWDYAYVAVGYPDWDWTDAYLVGDPDGDGVYKGYVNFTNDASTYAVLDGKTMKVIASGNTVDSKGFYEITVDKAGGKATQSANPIKWGIIGDGTSGGWDKDTSLDYDPTTRMWTTVTTLFVGKSYKFRGNSDWGINLGATADNINSMGGDLVPGGENFKVVAEKDTTYLITLNLTEAGKYTFTTKPVQFEQSSAFITIPGGYQGWKPEADDCYKLTSPARDFVYTGAYYMPENTEFKFYDGGTWIGIDGAITWNGDRTGGSFAVKLGGGGNINLTKADYFKFTVNLKKNTCTFNKTGWEIIGSATPNGWDKGMLMTYDPEKKTWAITAELVTGEMKFRWDGSWDINLGGASLDALTQGGDNLKVSAGKYTIVLDPEAKKATMTKN